MTIWDMSVLSYEGGCGTNWTPKSKHHCSKYGVSCVCVQSQNSPTSFDQPDSTLSRWDAVHVAFWPDAQRGGHRLSCLLQHLHRPHGLLNVLKVLRKGRISMCDNGKSTMQVQNWGFASTSAIRKSTFFLMKTSSCFLKMAFTWASLLQLR